MQEQSNIQSIDPFLKLKEVVDIVKVQSSTIYRWIDAGTFPRPRQLGANCVRWRASEIRAWQDNRPEAVAVKKAS
ncbi:hypothetical protein ASC97_05550 [Rhizobium sp. Root1203]|uniref:helix-turn-helix transcriptional regulator n=1 Tax=Rhizobium sp. Root1203 TaxID=1736427 RepID=UPI00070C597B|nr:hypothetical protein ASC97_05550 [Rhizobium sp. Root1203]